MHTKAIAQAASGFWGLSDFGKGSLRFWGNVEKLNVGEVNLKKTLSLFYRQRVCLQFKKRK